LHFLWNGNNIHQLFPVKRAFRGKATTKGAKGRDPAKPEDKVRTTAVCKLIVAVSAVEASAIRRKSVTLAPRTRSSVTNGKRLFVEHRGDTAWARRFRDVLFEIISDLGGADAGLSEGQRQLARRAATIAITCERLEGKAAAGEDIDLALYGMLTDRLGRTLHRLGLKRQQRVVSEDLYTELLPRLAREGKARREQEERVWRERAERAQQDEVFDTE
jgi:hypothetical protein